MCTAELQNPHDKLFEYSPAGSDVLTLAAQFNRYAQI
jgi:hypothetical protein